MSGDPHNSDCRPPAFCHRLSQSLIAGSTLQQAQKCADEVSFDLIIQYHSYLFQVGTLLLFDTIDGYAQRFATAAIPASPISASHVQHSPPDTGCP
jgi:hypothetical protein